MRACALNQVDMLLLDGRFPPPEGLPHVNGCEVTGTVEATGPGVDRGSRRGQRVIIFPGFSCGSCEYCLLGERTVCVRYGYLGAHKDGGYAELVKRAGRQRAAAAGRRFRSRRAPRCRSPCSPRGTRSWRRRRSDPGRPCSSRPPAAAWAARRSRSRASAAPASSRPSAPTTRSSSPRRSAPSTS